MIELKEDLYAAKKEEVSNNAYLVQTTVQGIVDGICKSLNKLMDSIYFEIIEPGVENATTSQIEQKFLELANCLFYVNGKCDELQIYSGVSSIGLKTAYNEAYLNPTLEKQKPTVAELLTKSKNRFELVIATSKRARQLADGEEVLTKSDDVSKVSLAADEIAEGKVKIC